MKRNMISGDTRRQVASQGRQLQSAVSKAVATRPLGRAGSAG